MLSRETRGAISSQFSTTSSGPKQSSHTCTAAIGYSSPHSRHLIPKVLAICLSSKKEISLSPGVHQGCTGREAVAFVVPPVFAAPSQLRPQRVRGECAVA